MAIRKAIVLESDFITNNLILARTYKGSKVKYIRRALPVNIETFYVVDKDFFQHNLSLNCSINGIGDFKIVIDNNWKQVIEKQIIVNNEWKQVTDTYVLINGNWERG